MADLYNSGRLMCPESLWPRRNNGTKKDKLAPFQGALLLSLFGQQLRRPKYSTPQTMFNVGYWPRADVPKNATDVAIGGKADMVGALQMSALDPKRTLGSQRASLEALHETWPLRGHMQRREFITILGGTAVAWPLAARAQQGDHIRRIGVLMNRASDDPDGQARLAVFLQALQQLGWSDG